MPNLSFRIEGTHMIPYSAVPAIGFDLKIANSIPAQSIHSIALRCQILIEAARRPYQEREREGLRDLFGDPDRWGQTLRSLLWTHVAVNVPPFCGATTVEVHVPCTFDFNVGATKYFHAMQDAAVPLCFQFSGTVFYPAADGSLQIAQIGWDQEARCKLPVFVWRDMMDHYYPNSAWLRLGREAFEKLAAFKRRQGLATWDEAIEALTSVEREVAQ